MGGDKSAGREIDRKDPRAFIEFAGDVNSFLVPKVSSCASLQVL